MAKILALILLIPALALGRTNGNIYRMPATGNLPTWGSIDLSQIATVGSSILGLSNGGTGISSCATSDVPYSNGTIMVCDGNLQVISGDVYSGRDFFAGNNYGFDGFQLFMGYLADNAMLITDGNTLSSFVALVGGHGPSSTKFPLLASSSVIQVSVSSGIINGIAAVQEDGVQASWSGSASQITYTFVNGTGGYNNANYAVTCGAGQMPDSGGDLILCYELARTSSGFKIEVANDTGSGSFYLSVIVLGRRSN